MEIMNKLWSTDAMIGSFAWGFVMGMLIVLARFWI